MINNHLFKCSYQNLVKELSLQENKASWVRIIETWDKGETDEALQLAWSDVDYREFSRLSSG